MHNGKYLVFEGMAGAGKTTQSKKLFEFLKQKLSNREVVYTREPGGTPIAEDIRKIVQVTTYEEEMDPICEAYLYAASRAQALRAVVKPALEKNGIVVADRSFVTSFVYQAYARGLGIDKVYEINKVAIESFIPDCIFYFSLSAEEAKQRQLDQDGDKWEKMGMELYKNMENWHKEVSMHPLLKDKWINIDASGTVDEVFNKLIDTPEIKGIINI